MLKRTWMAWVALSLCAAVFACGCQTLGAVNQLAQAVVGTAMKATNAVVDKTVKAITTPAAPKPQSYSPWVRNSTGKPQNFANAGTRSGGKSTGSRPVVQKRARRKANTTTRYGVEVDSPNNNRPKVFRRGHKPANSAWK